MRKAAERLAGIAIHQQWYGRRGQAFRRRRRSGGLSASGAR